MSEIELRQTDHHSSSIRPARGWTFAIELSNRFSVDSSVRPDSGLRSDIEFAASSTVEVDQSRQWFDAGDRFSATFKIRKWPDSSGGQDPRSNCDKDPIAEAPSTPTTGLDR